MDTNHQQDTPAIPSWTHKRQQSRTVRNRFLCCLLGGAVGDALGAPVEFHLRDSILQPVWSTRHHRLCVGLWRAWQDHRRHADDAVHHRRPVARMAISVYCTLVAKNFRDGVILAVNHDGDSDSTGAITGNLLGAMHGIKAIPAPWLEQLELRELITEIAEDLYGFPDWGLYGPSVSRTPGLHNLRIPLMTNQDPQYFAQSSINPTLFNSKSPR